MTDTPIPQPVPDFTPSSPAVTSDTIAGFLTRHGIVVVHFWAVWNGVDPLMDSRLIEIRGRLPDGVQYASCNIDDPFCFDFAKSVGVVNVPWLAVFVDGLHAGNICGLSDTDPLVTELLDLITDGDVSCGSTVA